MRGLSVKASHRAFRIVSCRPFTLSNFIDITFLIALRLDYTFLAIFHRCVLSSRKELLPSQQGLMYPQILSHSCRLSASLSLNMEGLCLQGANVHALNILDGKHEILLSSGRLLILQSSCSQLRDLLGPAFLEQESKLPCIVKRFQCEMRTMTGI